MKLKSLSFLLAFCLLLGACQSNKSEGGATGNISGTLTYGNPPLSDAEAQVYFIDSSRPEYAVARTFYELGERFADSAYWGVHPDGYPASLAYKPWEIDSMAKAYDSLLAIYLEKQEERAKVKVQLEAQGGKLAEVIKTVAAPVSAATTDAAGRFNTSLNEGPYLMVAKSAHFKGVLPGEDNGQFKVLPVQVRKDKTENVIIQFE